jgi:hypothetical protein
METKRLVRPFARRAPSPAMIVACIALTVALGGTSYAAIRLPAGSVGTKQLKRGAVTGIKVKRNALGGTQINEAKLARVPRAALADRASDAATADTADQATRAPVSRVDYRQSTAVAIPTSGHVRATVACDTGLSAVGGGGKVSDPNNAFIIDTNPAGRTSWEATATALTTGNTLTVFVICAQAASATP